MSTIVTFLIVGGILAYAATVAIAEADNGATSGGQSRRDPDAPTVRTRIQAAGQAVGGGLVAAGAFMADRARRGRERLRSRDRPAADQPAAVRGEPDLRTVPPAEAAPQQALAPVGTVLVGETVGEPLERATPTPAQRIQSFAGLVVLIALLGLAVAAVLGTLIAVGGRALDDFVG